MKAPSFVCLTNIPTPYRLFQFRLMHQALAERGWRFEVWFMARSEPGRTWRFPESDFPFPHKFLGGAHLPARSVPLHFNPGIGRKLREVRPEILLVAGGWANPTVWMASRSNLARRTIFWSESHVASIRRRDSISRFARKCALAQFKEFAVPGLLAQKYIESQTKSASFYRWPNLVNSFRFRVGSDRSKQANGRRILLIPARLAPEKGLLLFLEGLRHAPARDCLRLTVLIAGEGRLRDRLERWIARHKLDVRLLGQQSEEEMELLYAQADGFCLPSVSDPNPLSVIEALWAGLPLLLSARVGNHPECLRHCHNGFLFDPLRPAAVADAVCSWLKLPPDGLAALGENSRKIAHAQFEPNTVIREFLDNVLSKTSSAGVSALAKPASSGDLVETTLR